MSDPIPTERMQVKLEGPRPARLQERDELIAMINYVFRTSVGRQPTIASDWEHVYAPHNLANVMVVADLASTKSETGEGAHGKVVASTAVWVGDVTLGETKLRVGGINCVGTLPDYRRHGLGLQVMRAAQNQMRELGCQVGLLSTGINNWYRRLGWEDAGTARTYRLNRGNIALLPGLRPELRLRMVDLGKGDGGEMAIDRSLVELYQQQRMGASRTLEHFRLLARARQVERLVLAEEGGVARAYLLLHENWIIEWAGAAQDVVGLARAAFESLDDAKASTSQRASDAGSALLRTFSFATPGWQHPVTTLLDRVRIPFNSDYLGMLYLINPQAILDAYGLATVTLEPAKLELERGSDGDDEFIVRLGQNQAQLTRRQLTKLFFGAERISEVGEQIFPVAFWQWGLDKV